MSSLALTGGLRSPPLASTPTAALLTRGREHVVAFATEHFGNLFGAHGVIGESCSLIIDAVREASGRSGAVAGVMATAEARVPERGEEEDSAGEKMRRHVLEATVEAMREGVTLVDGGGVVVFANKAAEAMYGTTRGGLIGRSVTELTALPSWEIAHVLAAMDEQIRESGSWRGDCHNRRIDDGTAFVTAAHITSLRSGGVAYRLRVEENVTEQRRDVERTAFLANGASILGQSLDYRETLGALARLCVPTIADMALIDVVSVQGVLQRVGCAHRDPSCEERLCATPTLRARSARDGDAAPLFLRDVAEDSLALLARDDDEAARWGELGVSSWLSVPIALHGDSFGTIALAMNGSGRRFNEGDLEVVLDLAARAANAVDNARLHAATSTARDEAERANRAKSELLSHASHDLRTPLNAISGYAELLEMGILGEVNDAQRDALARIQRSQRHLLALINDLLNFTRLEAGGVDFDFAAMEMSGVAAEVTALLREQAEAKGISLHCESTGEVRAWADEEKVFQIVLNLLRNAIKFTAKGGSVAVRVAQQGDSALLTVSDTGIGIPADKMNAIFEPFTQVGRSFSRPQEGSGLGLAISRELTRAMGGELLVSSMMEQGSTFSLVLPREKKAAHRPEATPGAA